MTPARLQIPCPAKVNLFLAVGPPDAKGYHPIRTVFQAIGLYDTLRVEVRGESDVVFCNWPGLPEENTLTKTLRLARELIPIPPMHIELEKRIPDQTGLGGGSSDAAGLLRGIRCLWGRAADDAFLHDVAATVGKDVPFFLVGGRARGEGYGDRLTALPDPESPVWFVIARPEVSCSTPEAYARLDEIERPFLTFDEPGLYNDFERVAPCESLELLEAIQAYGAEGALLCGSGSGVFGVFQEEAAARHAERRLSQDSRITVFVAPSLTREESLKVEACP